MTELVIPRPGESINEVVLSKWFVADGDFVDKDQELGEIESDKATLPLIAPVSGKLFILVKTGTTIEVGKIACKIDESIKGTSAKTTPIPAQKERPLETPKAAEEIVKSEEKIEAKVSVPESEYKPKVTPVAQKIMDENHLSVDDIINGLRRIGKEEVLAVIEEGKKLADKKTIGVSKKEKSRELKREPMSQLRKKLSKRLVAVKNETAMLTTFNEADMSQAMALREKYQKVFVEKHGIKLGFMSLFTKAVCIALQQFPKVNSQIDEDNIITPEFVDIAFAVQTDKGLMVPVIRNAEQLSLAEIEKTIASLAEKARAARLSIEEMTGGTFTITNGGVFGSLFSTPIINPPQSAILGMHNIVERPVAVNGQVVIRPMMYLALSYDHRIIDGRDSVSFLVKVKELIENPQRMIFEGLDLEKLLLGI